MCHILATKFPPFESLLTHIKAAMSPSRPRIVEVCFAPVFDQYMVISLTDINYTLWGFGGPAKLFNPIEQGCIRVQNQGPALSSFSYPVHSLSYMYLTLLYLNSTHSPLDFCAFQPLSVSSPSWQQPQQDICPKPFLRRA